MPTRLGELILASRLSCFMHNVSSSYFDAASQLTVALLAASSMIHDLSSIFKALIFWLVWGHGLAGVVWPAAAAS